MGVIKPSGGEGSKTAGTANKSAAHHGTPTDDRAIRGCADYRGDEQFVAWAGRNRRAGLALVGAALAAIDGWHASSEGHNVLAEAAFNDLEPSLEFLGINCSD